jgi:integrase
MTKRGPYIFKRAGSWVMRYREMVNEGGTLKAVQRAKPFCPASIPTKEARSLAKQEMQKLEAGRPSRPELIVSLEDFVTRVYLPFTFANKRQSTASGYQDAWVIHFGSRPHIARKLLKDVKTSDVYAWLCEVAATDRNKKGELLRKRTLQYLKTCLSAIFTHAKSFDYFDGVNPAIGAIVPQAPAGAETYAYSLEEISVMLSGLAEPARTMVATAAFEGLRRSELMGLEWEGYGNGELRILRSIVEGKAEDCKTPASKSAVPLLPSLERVLDAHRERDGNPATGPIFRTSIGTPLDPNNVLNRQILPVLNRCATCRRPKDEHTADVAHKYARDESMPRWQGWHAFRRGLGTNLNHLGVDDTTIQAILRHENVATTQKYYIKPVSADSVRAMAALDTVLCSTCALESVSMEDTKTQ